MENKEFDNIIKDKLSEMSTSFSGASWDQMKSKMGEQIVFSEEGIENQAFDNMIKTTLQEAKMPFNKSHQEKFIHQYHLYQSSKRRQLYKFITRAAIILLLLFSCFHLYESLNDNGHSGMQYVDGSASMEKNTDFMSDMSNWILKVKHNIYDGDDLFDPRSNVSSNAMSSNQDLTNRQMKNPSSYVSSYNHVDDNYEECDIYGMNAIDISYLAAIDPELNTDQQEIPLDFIHDMKISPSIEKNKEVRLGVWASYDANKNQNNATYAYTFNAGLSVSKKIGNLELETGLGYGRVKFEPADNNNVFGSRTRLQTLKTKEVDLVVSSIPINAKYHVPLSKKLDFYALTGTQYNTVLLNNNASKVENYTNVRTPLKSLTRDIPTQLGVLQGGSLSDNSFFTAMVGLGFEKKFDDNTVAFVESSYKTQINPSTMRLTNDKLDGFSLKLGVKRRI